jgi:hypothetical protein
MGPEATVTRGVGIPFLIGVLVMEAMYTHPEEWSAFQSQRRANREQILDPFWRFVTAMGKQTVVAHADTQAAGDPPKQKGHSQRLPAEHEECSYGADVE